MKGICINRFGGPEVLAYSDLPDPEVSPGQVLIEVKGASVNYADIKARAGGYHLGKKPPFIPGIDVAGVVVQTGRGVRKIKCGDRVIAFPRSGAYAEMAAAEARLTFPIPDSMGFETAAACPVVAGTSLHMLAYVARLRRGENVLVHAAAGGVGSTALQVARALGASQVIGSVGSAWKKEHVRGFGADAVIDFNAGDYADEVKRLTGGRGVDVILNPIGGPSLMRDLLCLAPFGRLIIFGTMGGAAVDIPPQGLHEANKTVIGFSFGHYRRFRPQSVPKTMRRVLDLIAAKSIRIKVSKRLALKEAPDAHALIEARKVWGKIVLVPNQRG